MKNLRLRRAKGTCGALFSGTLKSIDLPRKSSGDFILESVEA